MSCYKCFLFLIKKLQVFFFFFKPSTIATKEIAVEWIISIQAQVIF